MACQMKRMKSPSPSVLLFTQVTPLRLAMIQPFNCIYDRRFIVSHGVNTHMAYPYGVSENPHFTFIKLPFSIWFCVCFDEERANLFSQFPIWNRKIYMHTTLVINFVRNIMKRHQKYRIMFRINLLLDVLFFAYLIEC